MRIIRRTVRQTVERYTEAAIADSWKGGGDPADTPSIEKELKEAEAALDLLIECIIPAHGLDIERK